MKGDRMAKMSSFGNIARRGLSDITNSLTQPKSPVHTEKPLPIDLSFQNYIDSLLKENLVLRKLVADKNKILELSGTELQKLRVNVKKMQMQNWHLVQSNSHMLAELNLGKDKLKELRHELGCKEALLKAMNVELQLQLRMSGKKNGSQVFQEGDGILLEHKSTADDKPCNGGRRRPIRSQSMGPSIISQQTVEKDTVENKRRCLRRQSARLKSHQQEPKENLFELEDVNFPVSRQLGYSMHEEGTSVCSSIEEPEKVENRARRSKSQESQRRSYGRPSRKAAEKVQSYKEVPINTKMRRED